MAIMSIMTPKMDIFDNYYKKSLIFINLRKYNVKVLLPFRKL